MSSTPTPSPEPTTAADADQPAPTMSPEACVAALKQLFPKLFTGGPKPLKLRIQADIQARAPGQFPKPVLSAFLRRYTGGTSYLIALSRASQRLDLDGEPAGELSEEHRQAAIDELARRRDRQAAQREEQQQAQRQRAQLLHDFERTTLTEANFCALKGIALADLEPLLATARREAAEAPPPPERRPHPGRGGVDRRGPPQRPGAQPGRRSRNAPGGSDR